MHFSFSLIILKIPASMTKQDEKTFASKKNAILEHKKIFSIALILIAVLALLGLNFTLQNAMTKQSQETPVNLDGDLKTQLSPSQRDLIWKGELPNKSDWFSGNEGFSTFELGYNLENESNFYGTCKIDFVDAYGNRPMPFMSNQYGAIPKILFNTTINPTIHFDIQMLNFTTDDFMRTAAVICLKDNSGNQYYFEQDIKDGPNLILATSAESIVDHFEFSAIPSPQTVNVPFSTTIMAEDSSGNRVNFNGSVYLGDLLGSVPSGTIITFENGIYRGSGALRFAGIENVYVETLDGSVRSNSNSFEVIGASKLTAQITPTPSSFVWEKVYSNVSLNQWVHFDVPFSSFIKGTKSLNPPPDGCYIESFYLVNECFGNGYISYNIKNWWLTV